MYNETIVPGSRKDAEIQCRMDGGGAPKYSAADTLTGSVWAAGASSASFAVAVAWLPVAADGTAQTGYDQGQVVATLTAAQAGSLTPGSVYYLRVYRTIAAAAGEPEEIATIVLRVRHPSSAT